MTNQSDSTNKELHEKAKTITSHEENNVATPSEPSSDAAGHEPDGPKETGRLYRPPFWQNGVPDYERIPAEDPADLEGSASGKEDRRLARDPSAMRRPVRKREKVTSISSRRNIGIHKEIIRRNILGAGGEVDEQQITTEATEAWKERHASIPDRVRRQLCLSLHDGTQHDLVYHAALNDHPAMQRFGEHLHQRMGRPSDRKLLVAVLRYLANTRGSVTLKSIFDDFTRIHHPALEYAYGHPVSDEGGTRADTSLYEAIGGRRDGKNVGACSKQHAGFLQDELLLAWDELRSTGKFPGMGKYLGVDGTHLPVSKPNRAAVSDEDEKLLSLGLQSAFGVHGADKRWRGKNGLTGVDLIGGVPMCGRVITANENEPLNLIPMIKELHQRAERLGVDLSDMQYVVADRGFCQKDVAVRLYDQFGLVLITPWDATKFGNMPHANNMGVPTCACPDRKGQGKPREETREPQTKPEPRNMRWQSLDPNYDPKKRKKLGLKPGDSLASHVKTFPDARNPILEYVCENCNQTKARLPFAEHPLLYAPLPYRDAHLQTSTIGKARRQDRYVLRCDLENMQNTNESMNNWLKSTSHRDHGPLKAKWIKHEDQAHWIYFARLLNQSLRRTVEHNGKLKEKEEEMRALGLLSPGGTPATSATQQPPELEAA